MLIFMLKPIFMSSCLLSYIYIHIHYIHPEPGIGDCRFHSGVTVDNERLSAAADAHIRGSFDYRGYIRSGAGSAVQHQTGFRGELRSWVGLGDFTA